MTSVYDIRCNADRPTTTIFFYYIVLPEIRGNTLEKLLLEFLLKTDTLLLENLILFINVLNCFCKIHFNCLYIQLY